MQEEIGYVLWLEHCFIWLRDLYTKKIGAEVFGEIQYAVLGETIKRPEKVSNGGVLEHIGEKRTLLNNILHRKTNWICHILRRYCPLLDAIEGHIMEVKGVEEEKHSSLMIWETEDIWS